MAKFTIEFSGLILFVPKSPNQVLALLPRSGSTSHEAKVVYNNVEHPLDGELDFAAYLKQPDSQMDTQATASPDKFPDILNVCDFAGGYVRQPLGRATWDDYTECNIPLLGDRVRDVLTARVVLPDGGALSSSERVDVQYYSRKDKETVTCKRAGVLQVVYSFDATFVLAVPNGRHGQALLTFDKDVNHQVNIYHDPKTHPHVGHGEQIGHLGMFKPLLKNGDFTTLPVYTGPNPSSTTDPVICLPVQGDGF